MRTESIGYVEEEGGGVIFKSYLCIVDTPASSDPLEISSDISLTSGQRGLQPNYYRMILSTKMNESEFCVGALWLGSPRRAAAGCTLGTVLT
jgi:hypothetical protein